MTESPLMIKSKELALSANVFDKLGNDRSVGEWIYDAVKGTVRSYGLDLLNQ